MIKENMVLKNYELPVNMIADLEKLASVSGDTMSRIVRKALRVYMKKELKKYTSGEAVGE
jgi:hypothetical protein